VGNAAWNVELGQWILADGSIASLNASIDFGAKRAPSFVGGKPRPDQGGGLRVPARVGIKITRYF